MKTENQSEEIEIDLGKESRLDRNIYRQYTIDLKS